MGETPRQYRLTQGLWDWNAFGRLSCLSRLPILVSNNSQLCESSLTWLTSATVDLESMKGYASGLRKHEWRNWQTHRI